MPDEPTGKQVTCPGCDEPVIAVVPKKSMIVENEEAATGKVWANCQKCGKRFLVYFNK